MLIDTIPENLHKLLQDSCLATIALLRKPRTVMVMTVHAPLVLVVAVLRPEDGGTDAAGEVLDVVFAVQGGDVGAS